MIEKLEAQLDDFDGSVRREALEALWAKVEQGELELPARGSAVNLHFHTFYSYNCEGYSPSKIAWLARRRGLAVAGIVDFDVLDGLEEFLSACRLIGQKGCVGLESRVFVEEFADREMTSPGEPGITYHMGVGFGQRPGVEGGGEFLAGLKALAQERNVALMERVNAYLRPVALDYERDVLPLTPAGNPTERHLCAAYACKAASQLGEGEALGAYWAEKLGAEAGSLELPAGVSLLNTLRAKTMKRGGVGYVQPEAGAFPKLAAMNGFVQAAGGVPVHTWLDGTSAGEQSMEEFLQVTMSTGVAALNIIPDRNYGPKAGPAKEGHLREVIELAAGWELPVVVGTEMNSPGQKFVDDFGSEALRPWGEVFAKGAYIMYAHSVLQRQAGLGYVSAWAGERFADRAAKNAFYEEVGRRLEPGREEALAGLDSGATKEEVLGLV